MEAQTLRAFTDELEKIAHTVYDTLDDVKKKLKPGDILTTQPRASDGVFDNLIRKGLIHFQDGNPFTHVGLYAGDDKVIDSGFWKERGRGVREIPLGDYVKRYGFRVLRPKASKKEKEDAIDYARRQVGKDFNTKGVLRLMLPTPTTEQKKRVRQEAEEALFCSQLVANAYPTLPFARTKDVHYVRPVDIQRSPLTKIVAELR